MPPSATHARTTIKNIHGFPLKDGLHSAMTRVVACDTSVTAAYNDEQTTFSLKACSPRAAHRAGRADSDQTRISRIVATRQIFGGFRAWDMAIAGSKT